VGGRADGVFTGGHASPSARRDALRRERRVKGTPNSAAVIRGAGASAARECEQAHPPPRPRSRSSVCRCGADLLSTDESAVVLAQQFSSVSPFLTLSGGFRMPDSSKEPRCPLPCLRRTA